MVGRMAEKTSAKRVFWSWRDSGKAIGSLGLRVRRHVERRFGVQPVFGASLDRIAS